MSRFYRYHPHIQSSIDGPTVNKQPLHLAQSDLDGACGPHCAFMALMIFGIVERDELYSVAKSRKRDLSKMWKRSSLFYFSGSKPSQLKSLFASYKDSLSCKLHKKDWLTQTIESIKADGVCIVGVSNNDFSHWTLAVGYGGQSDGKTDTLLLLDPDAPPIPMLAWNATLNIKTRRNSLYSYVNANGSHKVRVNNTLSLLHNATKHDLERELAGELEVDLNHAFSLYR
jgi:hypothetical protein